MDNDNEEKIKQIDEIYQEYKEKLADLRRQQDDIFAEFLAELEKSKLEELRSKLQMP